MKDRLIGYDDFVKLVIEALESAGVEYLIGGAVAAWAWGEPRATMDLDVVANIPLSSAHELSSQLEKRDMLVPAEIILETIMETRADLPINAVHVHSGFKVDIYPLRPQDDLRKMALERKQAVDFGPPLGTVFLHSPEDLIIYKLLYFSLSRQTKHVRDISAILATLGGKLDLEYINNWVERLGLHPVWQEILNLSKGRKNA